MKPSDVVVASKYRDEARKIRVNWEYACGAYYWVQNRDPRIKATSTLLKWNKGQRIVARAVEEMKREGKPVRIITLKCRQFGCSTLAQSYLFHEISTRKNYPALTIGNDDDNAKHLNSISRGFLRQLDSRFKPMVKYDNAQEILFANPDKNAGSDRVGLNSYIACETAGKLVRQSGMEGAKAFRLGQMFRGIHASECAHWPDMTGLLKSLLSSVPDDPDTFVMLESTANMRGDPWYQRVMAAMKGESEYRLVFVRWLDHEEYELGEFGPLGKLTEREEWLRKTQGATDGQIAWRRKKIGSEQFQGDEDGFLRLYPEDVESAFTLTGNGVFSNVLKGAEQSLYGARVMGELVERSSGDAVELVEGRNEEFQVFAVPVEGERYAIGADVAEGLTKDADFSAAVVMGQQGQVVATYVGKESPTEFAYRLRLMGLYYNGALVGVENNNVGVVTVDALMGMYPNLYQEPITGQFGKKAHRTGWRTTSSSKPVLIGGIKTFLAEHKGAEAGVADQRLLNQLGTFVKYPNGKSEAAPGCNDDLVIAYGIAKQVLAETVQSNVVLLGRRNSTGGTRGEQMERMRKMGGKGLHRIGVA